MYEIVKNENNEVEIKISATQEEWEKYIDRAYEATKGKFSIQGFRKGAAPRKMIEKNYGESVFVDEALDMLFSDEYTKFLDEHTELDIISQPNVAVEKFDDKGLVLNCKVALLPEVKLGEYKGLTIEKYTEEVDEKRVEKQLEQERERLARFVEAQEGAEAKLGDFATIDFTGYVNDKKFDGGEAKNYRLELGSHTFIDNFEDQIVGMKVGEERDVNVTFPEQYPAEELQGKPAVFKIVLHKIENKELPELNDEFASNCSEFETLEEYKASIRNQIQASVDQKVKRENENRLVDKVVDNATIEIPQVLIDRQLDIFVRDFETRLSYQGLKLDDYLTYTNSTKEALRDSYKEQAQKAVKTQLVLEQLVKQENLQVQETEVDSHLEETAKKYNKTLEEYKTSINEQNLAYVRNELLVNKIIDFLTKNNTIA